MRILVLTDLYPPHFRGGYELRCRDYVEELVNRGHEVFVLTSRWGLGKDKVEGNVYRLLHFDPIYFSLPPKKNPSDPLRLRRRYNQLKWAFACRRNYGITREIVANLKPDIAYIWHMGHVSISPVLAAQDQGIPTVFDLCDYWLSELKRELCLEPNWLKKRYRAAIVGLGDFGRIDLKHILVCSRSLMRSYIELDFSEQNITVIPCGVPSHLILDISDLPNLPPKNKDEVRLIFAGRLVPQKGIDVAIEALAHLVGETGIRHIRLDIIGAGQDNYVRQLQNMVIALDLEDRVQFVGKLEPQQLHERYAEYDVLLFTSRWAEPFGVTILEAMARGLPVIATNRGAASQIISDGENGLLVPPDEPVMLANAVKRLAQNPALAQKIRCTALHTVRENYTLERIVDQTEEYLETVLQQAHPIFTGGG